MNAWLMLVLAALGDPNVDPCANDGACRNVENVRIEYPGGKEALVPVNQRLPWVIQDNLLLVPGDWIIVRLAERDGALVPELVKAGTSEPIAEPADGEIRVKVHAFSGGNLIMEILSRRQAALDYAALVVVGENDARRTSVCSLEPGITVLESWQWPIRQIALWGFRHTDELGCKTIDLTKGAGKD